MADNTATRLERIENKMDKMAEALVTLARVEEKMENYNKYRDDSWSRMNKFSEKLDAIEKKVDENAHTVQVINKLFWVAIVATAGAIATQLKM